MRASELPNALVDRGIYWQIGGFTVVALASVAILTEFAGSEHRAFLYFEVAVTKLYWAFAIPLAGLFEGVRKLFERTSERRARIRQQAHEEGLREGRRQERERIREEIQRLGVTLSSEVLTSLFEDSDDTER